MGTKCLSEPAPVGASDQNASVISPWGQSVSTCFAPAGTLATDRNLLTRVESKTAAATTTRRRSSLRGRRSDTYTIDTLETRLARLFRRKLLVVIGAAALSLPMLGISSAGPTAGGFESEDVQWIAHIPFQVGTASGAKRVGNYLYVTSWREFSIYDISDPLTPELLSTTPFGFKFENEDVSTNGKIMLFSEHLPQNVLHIWDIEDKTNPVEIATLPEGGGHTSSCLFNCKFSYSATGSIPGPTTIVDLRDPTAPEVAGDWLHDDKGESRGPAPWAHDVTEVAPGLVLTSSRPIMLLDARKDPLNPKLLAVGDDDKVTGFIHSNRWPNNATDDIVMFSSEVPGRARCEVTESMFMTWDASDWKRTRTFNLLDTYRLSNGRYGDGAPPVNGLGCSAHWFEEHPTFRNGGLVAIGAYEHGTRFLQVAPTGEIEEAGWFVPHAGSTSAAYWITPRIVYSVDYARGIDVLRWKGEF